MPWASKDMIFCMAEAMWVYRGGNGQITAMSQKSDRGYVLRDKRRDKQSTYQ
jgi:hypothetical protein